MSSSSSSFDKNFDLSFNVTILSHNFLFVIIIIILYATSFEKYQYLPLFIILFLLMINFFMYTAPFEKNIIIHYLLSLFKNESAKLKTIFNKQSFEFFCVKIFISIL